MENYQFFGSGAMSHFPGSGRSTINYGYDTSGRLTLIDYVNDLD
jgi:hypothetical protein